jgi:hypothetical protein
MDYIGIKGIGLVTRLFTQTNSGEEEIFMGMYMEQRLCYHSTLL